MSVAKEIIKTKIYANNRILQYFNRRIDFIEAYINGGKFKDDKPYNGRSFRLFKLRDLNELLDDLKKGRRYVMKFVEQLQKTLRR